VTEGDGPVDAPTRQRGGKGGECRVRLGRGGWPLFLSHQAIERESNDGLLSSSHLHALQKKKKGRRSAVNATERCQPHREEEQRSEEGPRVKRVASSAFDQPKREGNS